MIKKGYPYDAVLVFVITIEMKRDNVYILAIMYIIFYIVPKQNISIGRNFRRNIIDRYPSFMPPPTIDNYVEDIVVVRYNFYIFPERNRMAIP